MMTESEWQTESEEALFWRKHLQPAVDEKAIEALCFREYEDTNERFQRGLASGDFYESDRAEIVWSLEKTRRWWAEWLREKRVTRTEVEVRWAERVLAERWF